MTRRVRVEFWAAWSLLLIVAGVLGPWSADDAGYITGRAETITITAAAVGAIALALYRLTASRRFAVALVLVSLVATVLVTGNASDPAGPFGGPGPNVNTGWGLWTALVGSISLAVASAALVRHARPA
jgi:hypothetical protein